MPKITNCLWFDTQAEEAMNLYVSVFPNSKAGAITRYGDVGPGPKGTVMTATFELDGAHFVGLNGGPHFKFSEAISFQIDCKDQQEVDYYWDKLSAGGETGPCGWLKDKFGLSWQVVPNILPKLIGGPDPEVARRVTAAMMEMGKLDVATLEAAAKG